MLDLAHRGDAISPESVMFPMRRLWVFQPEDSASKGRLGSLSSGDRAVIRQLLSSPRSAIAMCLLGTLLLAVGCGSDEKPRDFGKVKGTVTFNGKPLDHGTVIFQHVEGPVSDARINPDGTYELNAAVGETRVAIECRGPDVHLGGVREEIVPGKSIVPEKMSMPETSGLKYTIVPGEDTFDIKL